ncbi:MAG: diphosphate--fructose-6-phosphate 1-phosphotransferase [Spirochaetaceae bacterium]|jgi:pyrophosphate--fructose-6-phosphate 1-phosphotransferase|nr:diphosphate--fructose-6-phosphate 1-phosphotransferase [Spirochaetaceae bacterium]
MSVSVLQKARYQYQPKLPGSLARGIGEIAVSFGAATEAASDRDELREIFKHTYGKPPAVFAPGTGNLDTRPLKAAVILSGGQAPGGHNVIAGLYDGLKKGCRDSALYGILGGPAGLIKNRSKILDGETIDRYRNTGGFDIIGSGRDKIETPEQFAASLDTAKRLGLDAVVIIGGDDSNTNAALLAEYFEAEKSGIQVIGCPKTIDGDLKNEYIETSFGFDTAAKTYSELIGNIERDAASARKYWHFIKLMGRAASHIALECALQTRPNVCLISEEVEARGFSLQEIVEQICSSIVRRAERGDNFGVVLIPEGVVEFIPEVSLLIDELNDILAGEGAAFAHLDLLGDQLAWLDGKLTAPSALVLRSLPPPIAREFLMDRDPHGNVQVSRIETEKLLMGMVERRLALMKKEGTYGGTFSALAHFFGYEGRCAFPSNFDADYCYSLGFNAFALIAAGLTGYISSVRNLVSPASEWIAGGAPLTMMMNLERRRGHTKPVIRKALVELMGAPFRAFAEERDVWALETSFAFPGSIQYFGPAEVSDAPSKTLLLEQRDRAEKTAVPS